MAEAHIISKVVLCGNVVEIYRYSSGIRCGVSRDYDIVRDRSLDESPEETRRLDNIARSRQNIRRLIWANQSKYTKFLTLTYAKTVLDVNIVRRDITTFVQRMRRNGYEMRYLYVLENQKSRGRKEGNDGCLHVHMVVFNDKKIDLRLLNAAWSHGNTHVSAMEDINNIGAYVSKYVTKSNVTAYGKHVYNCSHGLSRGVVENFYSEGYSDHYYDGLDIWDVLQKVDVTYTTQVHHAYRDGDGVGHEQVVNYYQGVLKEGHGFIFGSENEVII